MAARGESVAGQAHGHEGELVSNELLLIIAVLLLAGIFIVLLVRR